jgi:RHS repeat-associated protein
VATFFYAWDHLGTVRLVSNQDRTMLERHDYEPFGVELRPILNQTQNTHQFTGHERDQASEYDYMHFRFYGSTMGRFMSADKIWEMNWNPQKWNMYTYALANPLKFNDPDGKRENPVTRQAGIDPRPLQGVPGYIRTNSANPNVGKFGMTRDGGTSYHPGLDINARRGTPLYAAEGGRVTDVGQRGVAGLRVQVTTKDGTVLTYAHLDSTSVKQGQTIAEDAKIGESGTSGNAAGLAPDQEHVHFAVNDSKGNRIDPETWLNDPNAAPPAHNQSDSSTDQNPPPGGQTGGNGPRSQEKIAQEMVPSM